MTPDPGSESFAAYKARRHFANLDGLRFLCIGMVLWHHAIPAGLPEWQIFTRGFLGVDFFFVLSGYLITTLLLREEERYGQISLKAFYIRRAIRILPIYVFVVSLVSFYYIVVQGQWEYLPALPYYYLFLANFLTTDIPIIGITWSLSVEEQYYMIWPLLLMVVPRRWILPLAAAIVALNVAIGARLLIYDPPEIGLLRFALPNSTYAPIILGSITALMLHGPRGFALLAALTRGRWTAALGLVALFAFLQFGPEDVRGWPNLVIHTLMSLILAALVITEKGPLSPVLTNPVIARFGVVSYGIYLYHLIALDVVRRAMGIAGLDNSWLMLIAYGILAYAMAELSFRTLEAYFRRFRPDPTPKAAPQGT